jgi:hypothetical protein
MRSPCHLLYPEQRPLYPEQRPNGPRKVRYGRMGMPHEVEV